MKFVFAPLFWIIFWSNVTQSAANNFLGSLRISTRHFPPYMYQDSKGNFYDGMEFKFLLRIAEMLNVSLQFRPAALNHSDICHDVAMNITDICIGGIFPTEEILKYASMSVTYGMDDLTLCVQNAGMMPMVFAQLHAISATVWLLAIFGYGYSIGLLLFLLVQFDRRYKRRNKIDWHHTTWLITLPAIIGLSPNFQPIKGTVRILYAFTLISAFFAFQVAFTRSYDVLYIQIPLHQVSSLNESIDEDYHLSGTSETLHLLNRNQMIPRDKVESFVTCTDMNECLTSNMRNRAVGGSRQNIINSVSFSPSEIFCFDDLNNIANYPIAFYMRKGFVMDAKLNEIVWHLLEAGFFVKWETNAQIERKVDRVETIQYKLPLTHFLVAMIFVLGCGSLISISVFAMEKLIYWKMKRRQRGGVHYIWILLEQFVDGKRYYFKNVLERLEKRR